MWGVTMPKQKITKEMVVDAAFSLARTGGMEQVLVKNIAKALGCSVQPIYSYCSSMEGLRREVYARVTAFVREFVSAQIDPAEPFSSTGRAYVRLAQQEPELFKLFILHPRSGIGSLADLYAAEAEPSMAKSISDSLKITPDQARQLHLHMLIYTIGIGTIFSVTTPGIPAEEIFSQQEQAYEAFLKQAIKEESR